MAQADVNKLKQDLTRRMDGALETLQARVQRAAHRPRASRPAGAGEGAGLWDPTCRSTRCGTVGAPEPRMLTVQVWDRSLVGAVEKAIRDSGLGLNPAADGQLVRVPIPQLTTERRNELVKMAHKYAEGTKVAVRAVRRDGMEQVKTHEKKHEIGEDLAKDWSTEVQKLTDQYIKRVDDVLAEKEKDIRQV